ncbi:hypothetical protein HK104_005886, partial [Borealophlyctis nickersoniae]
GLHRRNANVCFNSSLAPLRANALDASLDGAKSSRSRLPKPPPEDPLSGTLEDLDEAWESVRPIVVKTSWAKLGAERESPAPAEAEGEIGGDPEAARVENKGEQCQPAREEERLRRAFEILSRGSQSKITNGRLIAISRYMLDRGFGLSIPELAVIMRAGDDTDQLPDVIDAFQRASLRVPPGGLPLPMYEGAIRTYSRLGNMQACLDVFRLMETSGHKPSLRAFSRVIEDCVRNRDPSTAVTLLERMLAQGHQADPRIYATLLISVHNDERGQQRLTQLIGNTAELENTAAFNLSAITIASYLGLPEVGHSYLEALKTHDPPPSFLISAYSHLIRAYANRGAEDGTSFAVVASLHSEMLTWGLPPNLHTYYNLMYASFRQNDVPAVIRFWDEMLANGVEPDQRTYKLLIRAHSLSLDVPATERAFNEMIEKQLIPNNATLAAVMRVYTLSGEYDKAMAVYNDMLQNGINPTRFIFNTLMHACAEQGDTATLTKWWARMQEAGIKPDVASYTIVMQALSVTKDPGISQFHERVFTSEVEPDRVAYDVLMTDRMKHGRPAEAEQAFADMLARGIIPDTANYVTMMRGFARNDDELRAVKTFHDLVESGQLMSADAYNVLMGLAFSRKDYDQVNKLWETMVEENVPPNRQTYEYVLKTRIYSGDYEGVMAVISHMDPTAPHAQPVYSIAFDKLLRKRGMQGLAVAHAIWDSMISKGAKPTNAMIKGLIREHLTHGETNLAITVALDAARSGVSPTGSIMQLLARGEGMETAFGSLFETFGNDVQWVAEFNLVWSVFEPTRDAEGLLKFWNGVAGLDLVSLSPSSPVVPTETITKVIESFTKCGGGSHLATFWKHLVSNRYARAPTPSDPVLYIFYARAVAARGRWEDVVWALTDCLDTAVRMREERGVKVGLSVEEAGRVVKRVLESVGASQGSG